MITKAIFKTRAAMNDAEKKLVERVYYLDRSFIHSGEFDENSFVTAWNQLMEFWKEKKQLAVNHRLPPFQEVKL